ncbi:hypothetical protein IAD21_05492 [Abditibacteriota bacterium]|nr:hypothetical protein IAD21_05492 [Abditibacteriota bacterium]
MHFLRGLSLPISLLERKISIGKKIYAPFCGLSLFHYARFPIQVGDATYPSGAHVPVLGTLKRVSIAP